MEYDRTSAYLLEGDAAMWKRHAENALKVAKEQEATKKLIPVWVDATTTKLVDMEKIKKRKMEIIRVKIGKGELVWMEKNVAIKNGFINE